MAPHDEHHGHGSELSEMTLRVRALETILTEKGYVDPAALDLIVEAYETKIGPRNGAKVVARAWSDPAFKRALLDDATEGGRHAWPCGPRRRPSGSGREHAEAPQHGRLHALLLLSDATSLACRRSGTSRPPTARARSGTRAGCSPISA